MRQVLLLNASEEILQLIDWQRAISLLFNGKAEPPYNYDYKYKIPHSSGVFYLPKALRLKKYIHIPRRKTMFSRKNIHRRDKHTCQYCSVILPENQGTLDHVIPRSRGGLNTWQNLVCCCVKCNTKKGNRTPNEANMKLLSIPKEPKSLHKTEIELTSTWSRWA